MEFYLHDNYQAQINTGLICLQRYLHLGNREILHMCTMYDYNICLVNLHYLNIYVYLSIASILNFNQLRTVYI